MTDVRREEAGFDALIMPHLDAAYNLAQWLLRDPADAEDAVQEAFLRALKYFPSFKGGNPRAWILQIVRNTAYTSIERRKVAEFVPIESGVSAEDGTSIGAVLIDQGDDPETSLGRRRDREELDRLLGLLPVELRECIILKELEDLSYREIAQITDTPIGTVMSRLWRARRSLIKAALGTVS